MRFFAPGILLLGLGATATGCSSETQPTGPAVKIGVAPLTLSTVNDACYRLTVLNGDTDPVWQQEGVCSGQYGDGKGAITYIGPCDAQLVDGDPQVNTVRLELEELYDQSGPIDRDTYRNPCGHADNGNDDGFAPCELSFECLENQDVFVEFNLTVMRSANQGFFDIAVNFDDIFCSAKVDCEYGPRDPIKLLFNPNTGKREETAVVAFACTAGTGDASATALFMDDLTVNCDGHEIRLDPTNGPGNVWNDQNPDPDGSDPVWQYATYFGNESLNCDEASCNKVYWNIAIGLDPRAGNCHLSGSATAAKDDQMTDFQTPERSTYPVIAFDLDLTNDGRVCQQNPLNGDGSGVQTVYTAIDEPKGFCHRLDGTDFSSSPNCGGGGGAQPRFVCDSVLDQLYKQSTAKVQDAIEVSGGGPCSTYSAEVRAQYLNLLNEAKAFAETGLYWSFESCDTDAGTAWWRARFNARIADIENAQAQCN